MTPFLSRDGEEAVRAAVSVRALLVLDFDGTLAPFGPDPRAVRLRERTRALLAALALRVPCAVVSGRARADVAARVSGIPLRAIVGNHGAEPARMVAPAALRARVHAWAATLRGSVEHRGVEVEDKGFAVAVHLWEAADPLAARARIDSIAAVLPGARIVGGPQRVDVLPDVAPTKGDAVEAFAAEYPGAPVVYVGDDETDEDAFRSPAVAFGVRVGQAEHSAARFFVADQPGVDRVLDALLRANRWESGIAESGRSP